MDQLTPRQIDILDLAKIDGRVLVDDLVDRFGVTPQTVRRDLNELTDLGVLRRFHGGAVLASGVANVGYEARRQLATDAKRGIGQLAADLIAEDSSLIINIGTTTEQVATALLRCVAKTSDQGPAPSLWCRFSYIAPVCQSPARKETP